MNVYSKRLLNTVLHEKIQYTKAYEFGLKVLKGRFFFHTVFQTCSTRQTCRNALLSAPQNSHFLTKLTFSIRETFILIWQT